VSSTGAKYNAAMNGHGDPDAPWGPAVQLVPEIDFLDELEDLDMEPSKAELLLARPMKLGHDFLAHLRVTFDGPAGRILLAASLIEGDAISLAPHGRR
jgi:hypothetical protein